MHPIVLWFSTNILLFAPCTLAAQRPSIDNTSHSDNWRPATPKHLTLNAALWRINIAYIFNRFYPSSQATFLKTSFRIRNSSFKVSTTKNKTTCSIKLSTLNNNIVGQVFCVHIVSFCVRSKRKSFLFGWLWFIDRRVARKIVRRKKGVSASSGFRGRKRIVNCFLSTPQIPVRLLKDTLAFHHMVGAFLPASGVHVGKHWTKKWLLVGFY